jgi:L-asparaginase
MNILVITTGGTIGSVFDGASIDVSAAQSCAVAEMYRREHPAITFTVESPLNLLSERLSSDDLNTLARFILRTDLDAFDGAIFTCGSDKLGYLSAFIGLLTCRNKKPVAIVASDKVLGDPRANGYDNFSCAVELIERGERGSFVPYRNTDGVMYIHSATDLRQADLSDDFFSFSGAYAVCDGGIIWQNKYVQQTIPSVFDAENLPVITDSVALIHPYPMLDYTTLDLGGKRAVLHTLYHSSTLDSGRAILFMRQLGDVPLYLASFRSGRDRYRTAVEMIDAGAIPLTDISPECAYMKLLLAAAQDRTPIRAFMQA